MIPYNLHDSLIERFTYDDINRRIYIKIDLCNWLQVDYQENEPENIIIHMIFNDVFYFDSKYLNYKFDSNEIINCEESTKDTIKIVFMGKKDAEVIVISAKSVTYCVANKVLPLCQDKKTKNIMTK